VLASHITAPSWEEEQKQLKKIQAWKVKKKLK